VAKRQEVEFVITARDRTRAAFARIRRGFSRLRLGLGGLVGGIGFAALTKEALNFATSIEGASRRLGIAGDQLEALKIIAQDDEVAFTNLVTIIQRLSRRAGEATQGSTAMAQAFAELGVGLDVLQRGDPEEIFFATAEAAKNFEGTLGELQARIQKIGDIETVGALGFLRRGETDIRARIEELKREGQVLGREGREDLAAQEAAARRDLIAVQQEFNNVIRDLLPILRELAPLVRDAVRGAREVAERREEIKERAGNALSNVGEFVGVNPFVNDREIADKLERIAMSTRDTVTKIEQSGTLR